MSAGGSCLFCVPAWSVHMADSHFLPEGAVTQDWEWQENSGSQRDKSSTAEGVAGALA